MKTAAILLGLAATVALSACTTKLDARRVIGDAQPPVAGAPYNLPYTRFKLNVIQRVVSCTPGIEIKVQVTATPEARRDPLRSYVIDLESLQSFFKTTDVQVAYYDSGAIKSINASAEDRTGEFIASAAATAAKLVGAGAVRAFSPTACSPEVDQAVKQLVAKEAELKAGTARAEVLTEQLKEYSALLASMGKSAPQADKTELTRRMRELIGLRDANRKLVEQIEAHLKLVSVETDTFWPGDGETFVSADPVVGPVKGDIIAKWVRARTDTATLQAGTAVYLELKATEQIGRAAPCGTNCAEDAHAGLKYRMPAEGSLLACSALEPAQAGQPAHCMSPDVVTESVMINQLGRMYTLPLQSRIFSSKTVAATFSEAGVPTLLGVTSSAASDKAAATMSGIADAALAIRTTRAGREAADLESRIKVLKLKKELEVATQALEPQPKDPKAEATQAFTVDTALIQAELSNLEAKNALEEAKRVSSAQ